MTKLIRCGWAIAAQRRAKYLRRAKETWLYAAKMLQAKETAGAEWLTLENAQRITNTTNQVVTGPYGECPFTNKQLREMGWNIPANTPRLHRRP